MTTVDTEVGVGTPFTVLFVCTGNICRSPMAERLLQAQLSPLSRTPIRATSAGLHALVGYPMDPLAARVLADLGGDPRGHVGRQLTSVTVDDADLILTATVNQRWRILRDQPTAIRRAFTLREFVRLGA